MKSDEQRSPDIILEYFELLKWNRNGCKVEASQEILDSNEPLQSIKQDLSRIRVSSIEKANLISSTQEEIERIRISISSTERNLLQLREKINLARQERQSCIEAIRRPDLLEQFSDHSTGTQSISLSEVFRHLFLSVGNDLKKIYLDIKQAIVTLNISVLLQYFLTICFVIITLYRFMYLVDLLLFISITAYLMWKLICVVKYKTREKQNKNAEMYQQRQLRQIQELESKVEQRQQKLELNLYEFEQHYTEQERYLNQQKLAEQELTRRVQEAHSDLVNLAYDQDRYTENYQRKVEEIVQQEQISKLERLKHLERLTRQWLDSDIDRLTRRAMKKLNLVDAEHIRDTAALQAAPIRFLVGTTQRTSPSLLVEDGTEQNLKSAQAFKLRRINENELNKSELSYDGKMQKYGVYEFLVIFLCSNFLSYYRCYFNFIRSQPIHDEYCEYLYDSVVFTRIEEDSSLNRQNIDAKKQVYSKRLVIATNDGKTLCFRVAPRLEKALSSKLSQIDDAATEIRRMLRQRRIDNVVTNSTDIN